METLSTITLLPSTRQEIDSFFVKAKDEILNSNRSPLEILKQLKAAEETIKSLLQDKDIEDHFLEAAERYGSKTFDNFGVTYQIKEVGTKYHFETCKDSKWQELKDREKQIAEKRKKREEALKAHNEEWADPETGEIIEPVYKTSKTKVTVTIK